MYTLGKHKQPESDHHGLCIEADKIFILYFYKHTPYSTRLNTEFPNNERTLFVYKAYRLQSAADN